MRAGCFSILTIIVVLIAVLLAFIMPVGAAATSIVDGGAAIAAEGAYFSDSALSNEYAAAGVGAVTGVGAATGVDAASGVGAATQTALLAAPGAALPGFSGALEKTATLPTTSITFTPADFEQYYQANGGPPMSGIIISGAGGGAGGFLLNGAPYAMGTIVEAPQIASLVFENKAAGTLAFTVNAVNADSQPYPVPGAVTLTISVLSQAPPPQQNINEIFYLMSMNNHLYFSESDFNSAFRSLTGNDLNYATFSQPSTSYGRLYYNYTSSGSYEFTVASGDKFYRSGTTRISNVTFVPASDYYGTLTIYYKAYDIDERSYDGTVRIQVEDTGWTSGTNNTFTQTNTVTYSVDMGVTAHLSSSDFNASLLSATGHSLSYIRFHSLPSSAIGRLMYNLSGASGATTGTNAVTSETRYNMNASPDISSITFVPTASYTGVVSIAYTAHATNGAAYGGTLYIRIGQATAASTIGDLSYTLNRGANLQLSAADFQSAFTKAVNSNLSYIMFRGLPDGGTLYYNYRGASDYDAAVSTSIRYYRLSNPIISQITFVPRAGLTSRVT
ncbi:MAG: hypothetical protein FWH01_16385, partial [Oscillospiraceae bacterium]|nr:hypothetical protein [Oscillospiraceae bacterium]